MVHFARGPLARSHRGRQSAHVCRDSPGALIGNARVIADRMRCRCLIFDRDTHLAGNFTHPVDSRRNRTDGGLGLGGNVLNGGNLGRNVLE